MNSWRVRGSSRSTPLRVEVAVREPADLGGQALLDLEAASEQLDHACQLRQPEDPVAGWVRGLVDALAGDHPRPAGARPSARRLLRGAGQRPAEAV